MVAFQLHCLTPKRVCISTVKQGHKAASFVSIELPGRWPSGMGKAKYGSGGKNQSGSSLVRPPLLLRESSFWQTSEPGLGNGLSIHHSFIQQKWNEGHLNFRPCNMLAVVTTECLNSISVYRALFTKHILSFDPHGNLMMTPLLKLEN